ALPETALWMCPGVGGTQPRPRLLGTARAQRLALTGDWVDARAAQKLGLVTRVVSPARLFSAVLALARRIAGLDRAAVTHLKRSINDGLDLPLAHALALEQRLARALGPLHPGTLPACIRRTSSAFPPRCSLSKRSSYARIAGSPTASSGKRSGGWATRSVGSASVRAIGSVRCTPTATSTSLPTTRPPRPARCLCRSTTAPSRPSS